MMLKEQGLMTLCRLEVFTTDQRLKKTYKASRMTEVHSRIFSATLCEVAQAVPSRLSFRLTSAPRR